MLSIPKPCCWYCGHETDRRILVKVERRWQCGDMPNCRGSIIQEFPPLEREVPVSRTLIPAA